MKKTRYIEEQIAFALKQAETGTRVGKTCINMGGLFIVMGYLLFASSVF